MLSNYRSGRLYSEKNHHLAFCSRPRRASQLLCIASEIQMLNETTYCGGRLSNNTLDLLRMPIFETYVKESISEKGIPLSTDPPAEYAGK
jgi:hypothetical protein